MSNQNLEIPKEVQPWSQEAITNDEVQKEKGKQKMKTIHIMGSINRVDLFDTERFEVTSS